MNYQLPYLNIVAAAVFYAWTNKAEFLRATSVPTLALVLVSGIWMSFSEDLPSYFAWIMLLCYGLCFSFLAVACHRMILVDEADRFKFLNARPGYRELKFLVWVIVIYAITTLLEFPALILVQSVSGGVSDADGRIADWIRELASIPALYVLARLSLAFPATAIDKRSGLRWSWIRTRGNGWRIFFVVGLFPWLIALAISLMWRDEASVLEQVALSIITYVGLAIEVVALSFTYKELAKHYAGNALPMPDGVGEFHTDAARGAFDDPVHDGKGGKLYFAVKVAVGLAVGYLLIGTLGTYFADCTGELISGATSPGGTYRAELMNQTCKDDREQGLVLNIVQTASPRRMYSYPLSETVSDEVDLAWTSDKNLVVRYAGTLDLPGPPEVDDDVHIVFEKIAGQQPSRD